MAAIAPATEDDWKKAESLAADYVKSTSKVTEQIQLRRFEPTPFLLGAWWSNGGDKVLVYDGKVQQPKGIGDLPAYLTFLGDARIRALDLELLDNVLAVFKASGPEDPTTGIPWDSSPSYQELYPTIAKPDAGLKYVVHYVQKHAPLPEGLHGGGLPDLNGPLVLQRWSLQLWPVDAHVAWKLEGRVERPRP